MNALYRAAQEYAERGWSIIPIRAHVSKKLPALNRWKQFQKQPPTPEELRDWFSNGRGVVGKVVGLAVVCGPVSGNFAVRDFDTMESYERFASTSPDLARNLPTVETSRGRHVYFTNGLGRIVDLDDGELRGAGYVCLPPGVHPSGKVYRWAVPLPPGPLPVIADPVAAGLVDEAGASRLANAKKQRPCKQTTALGVALLESGIVEVPPSLSPDLVIPVNPVCPVPPVSPVLPVKQWEVDELVRPFVPLAGGQRNYHLFRLARKLKWLVPDAKPRDFQHIVRRWHEFALPVINTKAWDESWADFIRGWTVANTPLGESKLKVLLEKADASPLPLIAGQYETVEVQRLIGLCAVIQAEAVGESFPIAQSAFASALGVTQMSISRYVGMLVADGVLVQTYKGHTGRAGEYVYTAGKTSGMP